MKLNHFVGSKLTISKITIIIVNCWAISIFSQTYIDIITLVDVQNERSMPQQTIVTFNPRNLEAFSEHWVSDVKLFSPQ